MVVQQGKLPLGSFPAVLGHEAVARIIELGPEVQNASLSPGDIAVLSFHTCRSCDSCQQGQMGGCVNMTESNFIRTARKEVITGTANTPISLPDGRSVHGQFFGQSSLAKHAIVTEDSVVKIEAKPEDLPSLAPLGCGYLTGAATILNVLKPRPQDKVAVVGMGAVGFAALLAALATGVRDVIAIDVVDSKLETAKELGAKYAINGKNFPSSEAGIRSLYPDGVDMIVDTTGAGPVLESLVKSLAHRGTLALVGVPAPTTEVKINALDLLLACKKIVGVIEGLCDPQQVS